MARPLRLSNVMPQTLKEYGLEEKAYNYSVLTEWPDVVGEKVAAVTIPEKFDRGVLTVRVTNAVWKYELTMRKGEILRKLHARFGDLAVREILLK